ncbi:MAG: hypothetical protein Q8K02_18260 [Flavobacterium sp.]|nr:hypothetical protein [Flavobacterium sp.]
MQLGFNLDSGYKKDDTVLTKKGVCKINWIKDKQVGVKVKVALDGLEGYYNVISVDDIVGLVKG